MDVLFKTIVNPKNPKILAIAKNYVRHVKEMGGDEPPSEPVIFQKPFSSVYYCPKKDPYKYDLPEH
jgi:acylpyruvate hydrolase